MQKRHTAPYYQKTHVEYIFLKASLQLMAPLAIRLGEGGVTQSVFVLIVWVVHLPLSSATTGGGPVVYCTSFHHTGMCVSGHPPLDHG